MRGCADGETSPFSRWTKRHSAGTLAGSVSTPLLDDPAQLPTGGNHGPTSADFRVLAAVFAFVFVGADSFARGHDGGAKPRHHHEARRSIQGAAAGHSAWHEASSHPGPAGDRARL